MDELLKHEFDSNGEELTLGRVVIDKPDAKPGGKKRCVHCGQWLWPEWEGRPCEEVNGP